MPDGLLGAVGHFSQRHPFLFMVGLLVAQFVGMVALVETVGTTPWWRFVAVIGALTVWSLALIETNYRIGGDPR